MHTHVVKFGKSGALHFPAWARDGGLMVDLRLFGPGGPDAGLMYLPEKLRASGMPEESILLAADSKPQGFILVPADGLQGGVAS